MANFVKLNDGTRINRDLITHVDIVTRVDLFRVLYWFQVFDPESNDQVFIETEHRTIDSANEEADLVCFSSKICQPGA